MGYDPISSAQPTSVIQASTFNKLIAAIKGDFIPRNASGTAQTLIGSLGSTTFKWLKAHIESGYWSTGDIKQHHTYNGIASPGHGWMKCNGRLINQANYDLEHGEGSWATYVGSSILDGKFLPDMTNRYAVGGDTTQVGNVAITSVGNPGNTKNLGHTHNMSHTHTFRSANGQMGINRINESIYNEWTGDTNQPSTANTGSALGVESIQPDSIVVGYYMRVI